MSKIREIKNRIKAVKNIKRITKSMQMIAASKMKKAEKSAKDGKAFNEYLMWAFYLLSKDVSVRDHILFTSCLTGKKLVVLFAPNSGFTGPMINLELNAFLQGISKFPKTDVDAILVGKKLTKVVSPKVNNVLGEFNSFGATPTTTEIMSLSKLVLDSYMKHEYNEVYVLYMDFENSLVQKPIFKKILPAGVGLDMSKSPMSLSNEMYYKEFTFEPNKEELLDSLIKLYLNNSFYHYRAETVASELAFRVSTMKNASKKSDEIGTFLTHDLNRIRQDTITRELSEITTEVLND